MNDSMTIYAEHLKTRATVKMAIIMGVTAFTLIFSPNPKAFSILKASGLSIVPLALGLLCVVCSLGYLLLGYPEMRRRSARFQRAWFWILSAPLAAYFLVIGVALVMNGFFLYGFIYTSIYLIVFLTGFAVYNDYSLLLEYMVLAGMISLILSIGYAFIYQEILLLEVFHIPPVALTALCVAGAIGYATFLHPRVRALPYWTRQRLFSASSIVLPIYAIVATLGVLNAGGNILGPLSLILLHLIIVLLGRAIYRPDRGSR